MKDFNPKECNRCHKPSASYRMSRFNTQMCCDACLQKEQAHPRYPEAEAAELAAVRAGDLNFPGIGLPADL